MEKLQFLSVNERGLNIDEKRNKYHAWLKETKTDIIF